MTTIQALRRALPGIAAIALTATVLHAQAVDARWRAWTGCWTPIVGANMPARAAGTVCVLPTTGTSAVEIVSVSGSAVVDRTRIEADGMEHPVSRDGCSGTETARWSPSGTRVYVKEAMRCEGGLERNATGVMSFDQQYRWLDVRGISTGTTQGIAVARYEALLDSAGLPEEVKPAFALRGPAANNAILAASAPLTLSDIADVATASDTGVATTWLVERTKNLSLSFNGKQLEMLADQGVAPAVIDVLVALAYPQNFALNTGSNEPMTRPVAERAIDGAYRDTYRYSDPYSWYLFDPWYASSFYGYGAGYYGYRYGYGYSSPYGYYNPYGYYPGGGPIIVVNGGSGGSAEGSGTSHGRVVKGRGYTSGGSSGSSVGRTSSASSQSGGSSSGGSSGSSSSGSASSGGSSSSGRTAVRKPPE